MIAAATANRDSNALASAAMSQRELLTSVTQLGELEAQLDELDRSLLAQQQRLGMLQADFTGDQRTALAIVLSGYPQGTPLSQVRLTLDDGSTIDVPLDDARREALRQGGALQIFHGYVEPREQVVEVSLGGSATAASAGFVTLEPARDRLTLLRLDLSTAEAPGGASNIHATTWLNDARVP